MYLTLNFLTLSKVALGDRQSTWGELAEVNPHLLLQRRHFGSGRGRRWLSKCRPWPNGSRSLSLAFFRLLAEIAATRTQGLRGSDLTLASSTRGFWASSPGLAGELVRELYAGQLRALPAVHSVMFFVAERMEISLAKILDMKGFPPFSRSSFDDMQKYFSIARKKFSTISLRNRMTRMSVI